MVTAKTVTVELTARAGIPLDCFDEKFGQSELAFQR